MTVFETDRLYFDEVTVGEIQEVIDIESHKENRDYLWIGTDGIRIGCIYLWKYSTFAV